jgi:hypothetical protein
MDAIPSLSLLTALAVSVALTGINWDYFYRAGIARSLLKLVLLGRSRVDAKHSDIELAIESQSLCRMLRPDTRTMPRYEVDSVLQSCCVFASLHGKVQSVRRVTRY